VLASSRIPEGSFESGKKNGELFMIGYSAFLSVLMFLVTVLGPQAAIAQKTEPSIVDFKVQALYRAAKLSWKAKDGLKDPLTVQIVRAETFEEGPYKDLEVVKLVPGTTSYDYVDKSMGTESKYHYKLVIKETNESFGPVATRPYFSPPATHFRPSQKHGPYLAFGEATR
jgi:hypothetical protein